MKTLVTTIKRWMTNLKWLFNHPPTGWTNVRPGNETECRYCGSKAAGFTYIFNNGARTTVCWSCVFEALDRVMISKE